MFDSSKEIFISIVVGVFTISYSILVSYMMRKTRYLQIFRNILGFTSPSENAVKFYEMLMKGLENDLINNIDDVLNMYSGITGYSYDSDEKRYYLVKRLRGFLVFMLKRDGIEKEVLKKWKDVVTGFINELETESPYADVPSSERRVLLEIDSLIAKGECNGIKGRLGDLAGMIQNRNEEQNRIARLNRWSVSLTIVGLILTILFGGLSLYLTFRPPKNVATSATPVQQTQQTIDQKGENADNGQ